ncbi:MAG TPA: outer membrane beta-barrel protein [Verrucomicrobiae bacterium]
MQVAGRETKVLREDGGRAKRAFALAACYRGCICFCAAAVAFGAGAQESLRMSLASAEAARLRREAAARTDYYNLSLGPSTWSFTGGLGLQYNDNLRYTSSDQQQDLITRPQLDARMRWAVSDINTLNLAVGAGYAIYAAHSEYNRPFVTPGSELSLDFYVGSLWVNVHDRFSIVENGYLDPTVTGIGDYERLDNAAGVSVTWDLNKIVAKFGYDHVSYLQLSGARGQPDAELEVFSFSAGYVLKPQMVAGVEAGGTLLRYVSLADDPLLRLYYSDGTQWSVGAFYDAQLTQYIRGRASVGYTQFLPDSSFASAPNGDFQGVYAQLAISHRLNQYLDYTLTGGRLLNFAYLGGRVDQYFATVNANWHIFRKTALSSSFTWQHGIQAGFAKEQYDWLGPGLNLERRITRKLTMSLGYQYYWRGSDLPERSYAVNIATLRASYKF